MVWIFGKINGNYNKKAILGLIATIKNINKLVIFWYLIIFACIALIKRFNPSITFFIKVLVTLALLK